MKEALERNEGITRIGRMAGVESISRNLDAEDAAYARELGGGAAPVTAGEDMRITAGGNVTVTSPLPKTASPLAKAALFAALLGGGAGAGVLVERAISLLNDTDTRYELRLGGE